MRSDTSLADICSLIVDCPHNTAPESEEAYAYAVGTKAISDGRVDFGSARPVSRETYQRWIVRATPAEGDLIFCREAPVGPIARVPPSPRVCLGQRTVLIRPDPVVADPRYVLYALLEPKAQAKLQTLSEGSTVPHLNVPELRAFHIQLPDRDEQSQIAGILGALDDKIDSNRRLAGLLEEAAATLFCARFVDFVGVDVLEPSEIGAVPVGSSIGTIGDVATVHKQSVRPSASPDDRFEHFSIPAFDAGRLPVSALGREMLSAKTPLPPGDCVLLSKLNPGTKRVWWPKPEVTARAVCSPEFIVLQPHESVPNSFLYATYAVDERLYNQVLSHVTGTTGSRQRVRASDVMASRIRIPNGDEFEQWDLVAAPLYQLARGLIAESTVLAHTRDALLPKLISGEIRVPHTTDSAEVVEPFAEGFSVH